MNRWLLTRIDKKPIFKGFLLIVFVAFYYGYLFMVICLWLPVYDYLLMVVPASDCLFSLFTIAVFTDYLLNHIIHIGGINDWFQILRVIGGTRTIDISGKHSG